MLDIFIKLVIIALVVVSLLLVLVILMQRPKQEGLGAAFGSGMTDAAWGARTTDVLQKGTVYLGTFFFIFCLILSILISKRNSIEGVRADDESIADVPESKEEVVAPNADIPSLPEIDEFEKAKAAEKSAAEESKKAEEVEKIEVTPEVSPEDLSPEETQPKAQVEETGPEVEVEETQPEAPAGE